MQETVQYDITTPYAQEYGVQALATYIFAPTNTYYETTYTRIAFFALLGELGGLLYTLRNVSNGVVKKASDFNLDNSMIRKLYSVNKDHVVS